MFGGVDEFPPRFFDGMEADEDSSPTSNAHPHSSANAPSGRLASLLRRFRPQNETDELAQPPVRLGLHPRMLLARLASLVPRSPPENDASNELQQPSAPSRLDPHAFLARLSSLFPRSRLNTDEETDRHPTTPAASYPDAIINVLFSVFRSQSHINKEIELSQCVMHPRVAEVAPMRDREVLFVAPRPQPTQPSGTAIPGARPACPLPVRFLAYLVLFLCCASPLHTDGNTESTQQHHGQPQGPVQSQVSSVRTQPAAPSSSMTPTASDIHSAVPVAATGHPQLLPLRTRFVLFLCCASLPHADGH